MGHALFVHKAFNFYLSVFYVETGCLSAAVYSTSQERPA